MNDIIKFWFEEIDSKQWWTKDPTFDELIKERFLETYNKAIVGELFSWRQTPEGRLAEIIVLDQFSRNMFRDTPKAFASDSLALVLAQEAVSVGADKELADHMKAFMYMPYMHSESQQIHKIAIELFSQDALKENLDFEIAHKKIIDRFGRYPHRNKILGRVSTEEEIAFLKEPGSSF